MTDVFRDLHDMHSFYGFHSLVAELPPEMMKSLLEFRIDFLEEEMNELRTAESAEDVVDALIDLVVVAVGTLDLAGVDGGLAWREVQCANMAKKLGIKESRPNPFGFPDLVKDSSWVPPDHHGNTGRFAEVFSIQTSELDKYTLEDQRGQTENTRPDYSAS